MSNLNPARFEDSAEATEHLNKLTDMLNDPRLVEWLKATDRNYGTNTAPTLECIQDLVCDIQCQLDKAE